MSAIKTQNSLKVRRYEENRTEIPKCDASPDIILNAGKACGVFYNFPRVRCCHNNNNIFTGPVIFGNVVK